MTVLGTRRSRQKVPVPSPRKRKLESMRRFAFQTAGTLASSDSREEATKPVTEKKALELSVDEGVRLCQAVWMSSAIPRGLLWSRDTTN